MITIDDHTLGKRGELCFLHADSLDQLRSFLKLHNLGAPLSVSGGTIDGERVLVSWGVRDKLIELGATPVQRRKQLIAPRLRRA